jgi:hypothetical protein
MQRARPKVHLLFPRITTTSSLRNIYRNPARLTFGVAAATVGVCALVTSGAAAASAAGAPGAGAAGVPAIVQTGLMASQDPGAGVSLAGTQIVTVKDGRIKTVAAPSLAGGRGSIAAAHLIAGQRLAAAAQAPSSPAGPAPTASPATAAAPSPPSPCRSSTLHWWICHAEQVMVAHGTPQSVLDTGAAMIVVQHESNGNPRAFNGWDSNAAAGTPSEGIAQVIGPTFSAYALPGYTDIWNPVDNMIAAFRYAISRYGSMSNIPGVVAVRGGGSYVGY